MEKTVKRYRYRFSVLSYILFGIGFALALFIIIYNIYRISSGKITSEYLSSVYLSMFIGIIFIGFAISVLICSFYTVTKTQIKTRLSLICSAINLKDLTEIVHIKSTNKLAVFYKNGEFSNVVISPKHFDSFIKEVKLNAPHIIIKDYTEE